MAEEKKVQIEVVKDFKFAHRGCDVVEYKAGAAVEVSEDCAALAIAEKWAKPAGKAKKAAPENKDARGPDEDKAAPAEADPATASDTTE